MAHTIIVADDHDIIREGIKNILRHQDDYEIVDEAVDGDEVLEKVKKHKPDVLLLDITMPKKSGLEILDQINKYFARHARHHRECPTRLTRTCCARSKRRARLSAQRKRRR